MNATELSPGSFRGYQRRGETVVLKFENAVWVMSRCQAIGLAYFLSELVDPPEVVE